MAAENIGSPDILRDTELEQRLLEAVIADRNATPRSQQLQIGPSEVGGCRELLRAGLFEPPQEAEPETHWAAAAHVGQAVGADLERIFGERVGALLQQRYTTMFGMFGISISGGADLTFLDNDQISDLKSIDDMGSTLYDLKRDAAAIDTLLSIYREGLLFAKNVETASGGYELTQAVLNNVAKLSNYVQIAIYVMGAMQAGVISETGTGRLVFYDRSGNYQGFVAVVIPTEWVHMFYTIGQMRIGQVVQAQSAYEATAGNPATIAILRDKAPSFCFSTKVQCPRRMHCWGGSQWTASEEIDNQEHIDAANRYAIGRDLAKLADGMKKTGKEVLKGDNVQGKLPDGRMLSWTASGAINLVETTEKQPQTQQLLDQYMPPVNVLAEVEQQQAAKARAATTPTPQVDTNPPAADTQTPDPVTDAGDAFTEAVIDAAAKPMLTREQRYKALEKTGAPVVRRMAHDITGIELKGLRKQDAIDAILKHEYPESGPVAEAAAPSEPAVTDVEGAALADEAMQGGPAGDEAAELYREHVERAETYQATDDDAIEAQAERARDEFLGQQEPVNPGLGRVTFQPSEPDDVPAPQPPEMTEQEQARARLMRGPHVAPLLADKAPVVAAPVETLPDGTPYVPMENEDPLRPGLFLHHTGNNDRLRQLQYDNDPRWREGLLRQRSLYQDRIPTAQQNQ